MNHEDLDQLLILQERDMRIAKLRKDLASLPEQRARLQKQHETLCRKATATKQQAMAVEKQIKDLEGAVDAKRAYIVKTKTLQSNTRKNEEYQMCIQEVAKTEAVIGELEDAELVHMEELEQLKASVLELTQRIDANRVDMEETLARFDRTEETDREDLAKMTADRNDYAATIPDVSRMEYERMLKSKGVPVIVEMDERGHCGGCHMVVTENTRMKVLGGHELVFCDSCHRLLH